MTMDLLCQEMRDACWKISESLGFPRSLCSECLEGRRRCSDANVPSFNVRPGLQAGDSFEPLCAFFGMRVFLFFFLCVPLCSVKSSQGRNEGVHHLLKEFLRLRSFSALISFLAVS